MKVLILLQFPLYGAGAGTYTRRLADQLSKNSKNQVAIAAPDTRKIGKAKTYTLNLPQKAVYRTHPEWPRAKQFSTLSHHSLTRIYSSLFRQITEIVEEYRPDIIHVNHCGMLTWIADYIKSIYGIGYVVFSHGTGVQNASSDSRFIPLTRHGLGHADRIIANSYATKKWMMKVFGRKLDRKTKVLPIGIDLALQKNHVTASSRIDKKYATKGKKVVIYVGRLKKEKGVEYLLRAAKKINAEIFILGGGEDKKRLEQIAKDLKLSNVNFLGYFGKEYIEDLRGFYRRADVVVVPSVWEEPLGLVVLEAMAQNTPVVASRKGGIPLAVKDGKSGLLVRARSSKAISNAVNRILENPDLSQKLAEGAREIIRDRFDWAKQIADIENMYTGIIEKSLNRRLKNLPSSFKPEMIERERKELQQKISPE